MTEKDEQLQRLREAVDRKSEAAEAASHAHPAHSGPVPDDAAAEFQRPLEEDGRTQDVFSPRDKNAGKGKMTADKWNQ